MTPVRSAAIVRGDVPGLLRRGMPVLLGISFGDDDEVEHIPGVLHHVEEDGDLGDGADTIGYYHDARIGRGRYYSASLTIDWSDTLAVYAALHWLAEKGHPGCLWMLPTTHGGRVEAWDGLTAWEVAAVLVSVSVGRVARGMGPVCDLLFDYDDYDDHEVRYSKRDGRLVVRVVHEAYGAKREGWIVGRVRGPEIRDAGKLAADTAALADGCCLQVPGGLVVPT